MSDLVKRLRNHANYLERIRRGAGRLDAEAADAIEELTAALRGCHFERRGFVQDPPIDVTIQNALSKYGASNG